MSEPRITRQRRIFVDALGKHPQTTFALLKKELVGKGENKMDLATLYRIIETFRVGGLIHDMEVMGERIIFPCQADHPTHHDSVVLTFCENCGAVSDLHSPLDPDHTASITYTQVKSCAQCRK